MNLDDAFVDLGAISCKLVLKILHLLRQLIDEKNPPIPSSDTSYRINRYSI